MDNVLPDLHEGLLFLKKSTANFQSGSLVWFQKNIILDTLPLPNLRVIVDDNFNPLACAYAM